MAKFTHSWRLVLVAMFMTLAFASTASATPLTAANLSVTSENSAVTLNWTAATDDVGITRYEVWRGSQYLAGLSPSTRTYRASAPAGVSYTYRVVAYDSGGYLNSNFVTRAANNPPAAFPSRLSASGRTIIDENGVIQPRMLGFNVHVMSSFVWPQSHFSDMASATGTKIDRAIILWNDFEPTQGQVSASALTNLDAHVARAAAAGIYTLFEIHLNTNSTPTWTHNVSGEVEQYITYGRNLTQTLAARYANNKAVLGLGLNEPPIENNSIRNGNGANPYLEGRQRTMIQWFRAYAPQWIGFVAYMYASGTPVYNDAKQNSSAADADPAAYDRVGGNVIVDLHDYMAYCTNADPTCDGRQWNGAIYPISQGGMLVGVGDLHSTPYVTSDVRRSQQRAYLAPYKTFTQQANIPLMIGEWGWPTNATGGGDIQYMTDKRAAWSDAGYAIRINWNYGTNPNDNLWPARIGTAWRPMILEGMKP